tara:strand:- start:299 stop:1096 length:798 start_codon:yes stop_codon:yes gene_type:complete
MNELCKVLLGDSRETLKSIPSKSIQVCVTSPPYFGHRNYDHNKQIGLESTIEEYVEQLVYVGKEINRILTDDGTFWLNLGDTYSSGSRTHVANNQTTSGINTTRAPKLKTVKEKDLLGIPWEVALALRKSGWILRSDIIWNKPNPSPESVVDRPVKSHEHIFLFAKNKSYYYDQEAIERQDIWNISFNSTTKIHPGVFPEGIPRRAILAGSKPGDYILDPFAGTGTTGKVAIELGRKSILCELNPKYVDIINIRTATTIGMPISV